MATWALTGNGVQNLSAGTGALHVTITSLPPGTTSGTGNPVNHYDVALFRFGDGTGYFDAVPIVGGPHWVVLPAGTTQVGYACADGAALSVTEVAGGGGGGGGVINLDDLADVVITSPADTQVLTYHAATSQWINAAAPSGGVTLGGTTVLLNTSITTNVSLSIGSGTWTDFYTFPTFTPTITARPIFAAIGGCLRVDLASTVVCTARFVLDPAGTPAYFPLGGEIDSAGRNNALSASGGRIYLGNTLGTTAHTLKLQIFINTSSGTMHCNNVTVPDSEFVHLTVTQE